MKRLPVICIVAISIVAASEASAKAPAHRRTPSPAAAPAQQQIACTVSGCAPVPAGCTPVEERTWGGLPTGYDTIVCAPGVWPLK